MQPSVDDWWRILRVRLLRIERVDAMTPDQCEQRVREIFAPHFPDVDKHVVLPEPYKQLLTQLGDWQWGNDRLESNFVVHPASHVVGHLEWHSPSAGTAEVRHSGAWVELSGHWSRHWDFICVDPTKPTYGMVWATEDAHPWSSFSDLLGECSSLEAWLEKWDRCPLWRNRDRSWLAPLAPEDAAALGTARSTGDLLAGLELIIRALDQPIGARRELDRYEWRPPDSGILVFEDPDMTALLVESAVLEGDARELAASHEAKGRRVLAVVPKDE